MKTIAIRGAAEHNLKGFDLDLPRNALIVVTGVSGSGKSSLAFDTICREAQRRYLETFSSYTRQFLSRWRRPAVHAIDGLSPAIAVDQRTTVRNPRSTVGTLSGLNDDLRLLVARLGTAPEGLAVDRRLLSFNTPTGACPSCKGLGVEDRLDPAKLVADPAKTIRQGALVITTPTGYVIYSQVTIDVLDQVCRAHGFDVDTPWRDLTDEQRAIVLNGSDRIRIPYGKHPLESRMRWTGITARPRQEGVYKGVLPVMEEILRRSRNRNILRFVTSLPCRACGGTRLSPEARSVRFRGQHVGDLSLLSIEALARWFEALEFDGREAAVGQPLREVVRARTALLERLGLGHLALDRPSPSLSGGEAQRLRLASQLGSALSGVLYVLDEPSIGLHPTEHDRLLEVLHRLRDNGNTVLVVEHDEQTIRQADWIVDVGPAAGEHGGQLLFSGPLAEFEKESDSPGRPLSRTRAFLRGAETVAAGGSPRPGSGLFRLADASRHNLQHLDVDFLAGAFNVVTGVSGAGKSSLVAELVERVEQGRLPGAPFDKVVHVDQSPIGRTPRSNPATYTGLSDVVRDLFAAEPDAVARGFGKGRFSFNVAGGRCEACQGAGIQEVGMHFLGAVDVTCDVCGGRRFNEETLEITVAGRTIHEVLELTLEEAATLFAGEPRASRILAALLDLGLGYLRLGQPSTTLSGGEAQRVKLASELARAGRGRMLYVLDEPTTGLHSADVVVLLAALSRLVDEGHTVVTIEHHLDVIRQADRVIDLGPGSGRHGGQLVAAGTPAEVAAVPESVTGRALRPRAHSPGAVAAGTPSTSASERCVPSAVAFRGVRTHNLKGIDARFPMQQVTVVTGVSGSGKSSLAFDTLYAEGRNRFTESFSAYARRFVEQRGDAEFDEVSGLTPAVAIRQHAPSRNPRSTVGTMTEIADYYRLLFARVGIGWCPACERRLEAGHCPACGWHGTRPLTATMFSPHAEQGACPSCKGLGQSTECDPDRLLTHPDRSILYGAMDGHKTGRFYGEREGQYVAALRAVGRELGFDFDAPWCALPEQAQRVALYGAGERPFEVEWHYRRGGRSGTHRFTAPWPGLLHHVQQEYERKHADRRGEALEPLMRRVPCAACRGTALKPEPRAVRVAGRGIAEWLALTVRESVQAIDGLLRPRDGLEDWSPRSAALARDLLQDVRQRLSRLADAGLDYLSLDRPASTLSAGEAQRTRLASEIGSGLTGITYVLDEPTAGLHPRDTRRLLRLVRDLADAGNAVVVVEHDLDVVSAANQVIDLGPGAGEGGGQVIACGTPEEIARREDSPTGLALKRMRHPERSLRADRRVLRPGLTISHATCHNLADVTVEIPAGGLVAVTGVSGSGKSSLIFDVLAPALLGHGTMPGTQVTCHAAFDRVVVVDRDAAAASASSTPATLTGVFDRIRDRFAATPEARSAGLTKKHFTTATKGGRCEACEGAGRIRVSMDFLPDVWVTCDECDGQRFGTAVLGCRLDGRTIADVLEMSVARAAVHFAGDEAIRRPLALLEEVGLGYVRLGQGTDTLSGGERQRLRLAADLLGQASKPSLFLFDEPTTGLHAADVSVLLRLFQKLVAAGHSLIVVEHHPDIVRQADWVIDLGPEGGDRGGRVVATGTPEAMLAVRESWTGRALSGDWPAAESPGG